jgi:hypothetical protein
MAAHKLDIENINAAVAGMNTQVNAISQGLQAYHGHVEELTTELSRSGNYLVGQIHQELAEIRQITVQIRAE